MTNSELYRCRVCGLWQDEPPWGADGNCPTYNHCPCCGVEFGYGDATLEAARKFREEWLAGGAKWDDPEMKPEKWDANDQLQQLSPRHRSQ